MERFIISVKLVDKIRLWLQAEPSIEKRNRRAHWAKRSLYTQLEQGQVHPGRPPLRMKV